MPGFVVFIVIIHLLIHVAGYGDYTIDNVLHPATVPAASPGAV